MGQLPNDTVIMVSFRPSSASTAAPHEARVAPGAASGNLVINHGGTREVQSAASGSSITLADPALTLTDNTVVDAADDLLLLKDAAAALGTSSLYWVFLYARDTAHPPYTVNPADPQARQSYTITSNDGGRVRIVTDWPLAYAGSAAGPIPPFPG